MNDKTLEELRYYFNGYGSRHDETILKLIDQNKRYREAIKAIEKYANDCIDVEVEMNPHLVIDDIKTLEESE